MTLPLRRSRSDSVLAGVLGGFAQAFQLDPFRVRLGFFVLTALSAGFPGILLYLVLLFVIPEGRP
jgi:phage shock protein C